MSDRASENAVEHWGKRVDQVTWWGEPTNRTSFTMLSVLPSDLVGRANLVERGFQRIEIKIYPSDVSLEKAHKSYVKELGMEPTSTMGHTSLGSATSRRPFTY